MDRMAMNELENSGRHRGKRWLTAAGLLVATLAVGGATRVVGGPAPADPAATGDPAVSHFSGGDDGAVSFEGNLDRTTVLRGTDGRVRMELRITGEERIRGTAQRLPTDLVVILDRSGSMSGTKMLHARAAVRELMARIGAEDRLSLVTYANLAEVSIALAHPTRDGRRRWRSVLDSIHPSGGTHMSAGLDTALEIVESSRIAGRIPRVILISDGMANQGDASLRGLTARARRAARGEYVLSTVGVGEQFDEDVMTAIADAGTGNYYYLRSAENLALVFSGEFAAARTTVASGLTIAIRPGPGVRVVDVAGYPLERKPDGVTIRPGPVFSGQERRLWVTLAVPSDDPELLDLGEFSLSYTDGGERHTLRFGQTPKVACVESDREYLAGFDGSTWARSVTEEAYGHLEKEIAEKAGRGDYFGASSAIDDFIDHNAGLNRHLAVPEVADQLLRAKELRREIDELSQAPEQEMARRRFRKVKQESAVDRRRQGSKPVAIEGER